MNIPSYMCIICSLSGDIIQTPDEISIKSIYDIISPVSLSTFKQLVSDTIRDGNFLNNRKVKLVDDKMYFTNFEVTDTSKICFHFKLCNNTENDDFWYDSVIKYNYHINRWKRAINSTSELIQNFIYKNRSDITEILKKLSEAYDIQYAMLLFRNGHDHLISCMDNLTGGYCINNLEEEFLHFEDKKFTENIIKTISDNFKIKKYENTYMTFYYKDIIKSNKSVYILKLKFGPKDIGYLEFITHSNIQLSYTELKLIESLGSILAYVINNKFEQLDVEKYIKEKLLLPT